MNILIERAGAPFINNHDQVAPWCQPGWFDLAGRYLNAWVQVWHERRSLAQLDQTQIADLGLGDENIQAEYQKPFWKLDEGLRERFGLCRAR